jgi:hypothetical protein
VTQYAQPDRDTNMSLGFEGTSNGFDTAIANSVGVGIIYVVAARTKGKDYWM